MASVADIPWFGAEPLGIDKAWFCDLRRGREDRVPLEKLIRMLATVNRDPEIVVVNTGPERLRWLRILCDRREAAKGSSR